jgi:hypothetical protein
MDHNLNNHPIINFKSYNLKFLVITLLLILHVFCCFLFAPSFYAFSEAHLLLLCTCSDRFLDSNNIEDDHI